MQLHHEQDQTGILHDEIRYSHTHAMCAYYYCRLTFLGKIRFFFLLFWKMLRLFFGSSSKEKLVKFSETIRECYILNVAIFLNLSMIVRRLIRHTSH